MNEEMMNNMDIEVPVMAEDQLDLTELPATTESDGKLGATLLVAGGALVGGAAKAGYDKFVKPHVDNLIAKHREKKAAKKVAKEAEAAASAVESVDAEIVEETTK